MIERGLCESRTRAQALLMEGKVRVKGQVERKSSRTVDDTVDIKDGRRLQPFSVTFRKG